MNLVSSGTMITFPELLQVFAFSNVPVSCPVEELAIFGFVLSVQLQCLI